MSSSTQPVDCGGDSEWNSSRWPVFALSVLVVLVVTLFPYEFDVHYSLLFVPFGFSVAWILSQRKHSLWSGLLWALIGGGALSAAFVAYFGIGVWFSLSLPRTGRLGNWDSTFPPAYRQRDRQRPPLAWPRA